jgi:hypothetical protein
VVRESRRCDSGLVGVVAPLAFLIISSLRRMYEGTSLLLLPELELESVAVAEVTSSCDGGGF